MIEYLSYEFRPKFVLVTTADVKKSPGIKKKVMEQNIAYSHYHAQYKIVKMGGKDVWLFRFIEIDFW